MTHFRVFLSRLRGLFHNVNPRLDEELSTHVDLLTHEYQRTGMPPEEARAAARRDLGPATQIRETHREQRRLPFFDTLFQDLRYTFRQLRGRPGFALTAILTLALGIGANTAIFRVLDSILLQPLPVRDPDQLVLLQGYHNGKPMGFSYPLFREMAGRQHEIEGMFTATDIQADAMQVRLASGGYFRLLRVDARLGRVFTQEDDWPSAAPVAVISNAFWLKEFGGNADALGKPLKINSAIATIVGVTPPGFFGEQMGSSPDVWLPINMAPSVGSTWLNSRGASLLSVPMARLRPDVPLPQAQAALNLLYGQLTEYNIRLQGTTEFRLDLQPGAHGVGELRGQFSRPLWILMGMVGFLVLIACCNLANLLLARATARTHEIGVRLAMGAARWRLIRQLLTESLVLAGLGSLAGFALAIWGSAELVRLASPDQPWRISMDLGWRLAGFTALITVGATCLFGLVPALTATSVGLNAALQANRRNQTGGRSRQGAVRTFVVAQVAISLLLVVGASLLVRSFWNVMHQDFGYRGENLLMARVAFDVGSFKAGQSPSVQSTVLERVQALPGVQSAALASTGPLGSIQQTVKIALPEKTFEDGTRIINVTPGYFETMGIRIIAGRDFTQGDNRKDAAKVAIISETAARTMFGGASPIGQFFSEGPQFSARDAIQIVGVAHDLRFSGPREDFGPLVFQPLFQAGGILTTVAVRPAGDPARFVAPVVQILHEVAPSLKLTDTRPIYEILESKARQERMLAWLSGAFGALALVLASVGLYGVIAYRAELRTQEFGIRLALGARPEQVRGLLLREVAGLLAAGLAIGTVATIALGKWMGTLLFGLTSHDPVMLVFAGVLLSSVAALAGYLPALRAARMDPMTALRQE